MKKTKKEKGEEARHKILNVHIYKKMKSLQPVNIMFNMHRKITTNQTGR